MQLGAFLKRERGEMTYAQFARRVGISKSTVQRMEQGEQNVTLDTLEAVLAKTKRQMSDIFAD